MRGWADGRLESTRKLRKFEGEQPLAKNWDSVELAARAFTLACWKAPTRNRTEGFLGTDSTVERGRTPEGGEHYRVSGDE